MGVEATNRQLGSGEPVRDSYGLVGGKAESCPRFAWTRRYAARNPAGASKADAQAPKSVWEQKGSIADPARFLAWADYCPRKHQYESVRRFAAEGTPLNRHTFGACLVPALFSS
jgi:hypothetical protein